VLGFPPDVFWSLTPKEFTLAGQARAADQRDWRMMQAWFTARLTMADPKSFPSFEKLTGRAETVAPGNDVAQAVFARLAQIREAQEKAKEPGNG
jgi:hypothetical protein